MNTGSTIVLFIVLIFCSGDLFAADRSNAVPSGVARKISTEGDLPSGWEKRLSKGRVLDYDVFRMGQLVYREPSAGVVSLRVKNKVIRIIENTREIVDVLDTL